MRYRKKPIVIEAIQYRGGHHQEVLDWANNVSSGNGTWLRYEYDSAAGQLAEVFQIHTKEGVMTISPGDFVICGVHGEFYPCKPDIFLASYEPTEDVE